MFSHSLTKLFSITAFAVAISTTAFAANPTEVGFFAGIKTADYSTSGISYSSKVGLAAGIIAINDFGGPVLLRSGLYYSERKTTATATSNGVSSSTDISISYLDVPITALYRFNDMFGVFGGAVADIKVASSCSGCGSSFTAKSGALGAQIGVNVKFDPNWSAEAMYDIGLTDAAELADTSTKINSLGASIVFTY